MLHHLRGNTLHDPDREEVGDISDHPIAAVYLAIHDLGEIFHAIGKVRVLAPRPVRAPLGGAVECTAWYRVKGSLQPRA